MTSPAVRPKVLQRIERFVGRTTNWMYDHLRHVPRHEPLVLCDKLENRDEFPLLEARMRDGSALSRRAWRRLAGDRPYLLDALWLRRNHPVAMHSHFGYVGTEDFGLREFLQVPWLVSFYGADVYELGLDGAWRAQYARMFERLDVALALGPQMATGLEALGCPKSKIVVHALGVDIESIPTRPRAYQPGTPLRVLYAGTFREKKGVEYMIRGAAEARRRGVRMEITLVGDAGAKPGDAETKAAIFREIDRLDLRDIVTHHAFVPFERLMEIGLQSHVFVAPSVTSANGDAEGTPFVLQQMMASEMPVIATAHSDIPFIFGEHRGQLLPERDAQAIASRLEEYADDADKVTRDGLLMRDRMRSAFDVRDRAAILSDIYDSLTGVRPPRARGTVATDRQLIAI